MYAKARQQVLPETVVGFHHHARMKYIHLVVGHAPTFVTPCGRIVKVRIELDSLQRIDWRTICPTCLDGVPGFLDWWRTNHQPIPY